MLDILFISDYVCPYCLVAKEALKQALEEMKIEVKITWQPLELTVEPAPRVDTYSDERRRANYQVLVEPCKQLGLDRLYTCYIFNHNKSIYSIYFKYICNIRIKKSLLLTS